MRINVKTRVLIVSFFLIFSACKKDEEEKVVAKFEPSATQVGQNESVSFVNESENADNYKWSFGDGEVSFEENPVHSYKDPGNFTVKLVASSDNGSDSVSAEIKVIEVTIFEGQGVKSAQLYETWSELEGKFGSDTLYFRNYLADYEVYHHLAVYLDKGLGFDFFTTGTTIADTSATFMIRIYENFAGGTASGITIGSNINDATKIYGEPETVEGNGYTGYWYESLGIDFYTFDSELIEEIDIYEPESSRKSLKGTDVKALRESIVRGPEL